jgi:hypothetical protein
MARTAKGDIVSDAAGVGAEPEHLDALDAEERHTGRVGLGVDPDAGEVFAQMAANSAERRAHVNPRAGW